MNNGAKVRIVSFIEVILNKSIWPDEVYINVYEKIRLVDISSKF